MMLRRNEDFLLSSRASQLLTVFCFVCQVYNRTITILYLAYHTFVARCWYGDWCIILVEFSIISHLHILILLLCEQNHKS